MKNKIKICLILLLVISVTACQNQQKSTTVTTTVGNHLKDESSPYLLQHSQNPVDWYPWNETALAKAKKENKMLIISVGYSACHWCHVMEHESFEDEEVAKLMNDNFVSIKVDREERPDVDAVYMAACHLSSDGSCGWPLNAFALPDGRPIWAGTYFPKDNWTGILKQFIKEFKEDPAKLEEYAAGLTEGIQQQTSLVAIAKNPKFQKKSVTGAYKTLLTTIDLKKGGRKGSPKFPMPNVYESLLHYYGNSKDEKALEAVTVTLDNIANGGIYDQIGGGFARYSTDEDWKAPHFEKMLYDNGQLVSLYSRAYQLTKKPLYKKVVVETLDFVERELMDKKGGFYASLDADSEGEEGKFYVWSEAEVDAVFKDETESEIFKTYFSVKKSGNWEKKNILWVTKPKSTVIKEYKITIDELEKVLEKGKKALMKVRSKRIRPNLDNKVLTAWNALMLKGYVDAYKAFGKEKYLKTALQNANFLMEIMLEKDGRLNRNYNSSTENPTATINAFLDDYALLAEAFIGLYEVTFDEKWLERAKQLTNYATAHFYDKKSGLYFYTSDLDAALISRKMELFDNVISASNSVMAKVQFKLGTYYYDNERIDLSQRMLQMQLEDMNQKAGYIANWLDLYLYQVNSPFEVAILGNDFNEKRKALQSNFLPNAFFLGGKAEGNLELLKNKLVEGETKIYVCKNRACKLPTGDVEKALGLMK